MKYHLCKTCGKKIECTAERCFVPDDACGGASCATDLTSYDALMRKTLTERQRVTP